MGKSNVGKKNISVPPENCDSTVVNLEDSAEFIIFTDGQKYPEYLIILQNEQ